MGATMGKNGMLLDSLPSAQGTLHVAMLGLDSAGKTTALYRLKLDQYLNAVTTIGFNCEKVRGSLGKAKGVQFLVWDVGGQEKLRPLWRSYTRCTDGIVFVVDSVDVERMEEAKMELMRTAKCSDNYGVPILIFANKQDLPGAKEPKELEKLLGLHELCPMHTMPSQVLSTSSSVLLSSNPQYMCIQGKTCDDSASNLGSTNSQSSKTTTTNAANDSTTKSESSTSTPITNSTAITTSTSPTSNTVTSSSSSNPTATQQCQMTSYQSSYKGWYIQPACAITGDGLQEGLEALYDMILKKRKLNKAHKKKR